LLCFLKFREDFFHRYLTGDVALRERRNISRQKFIIAESSLSNVEEKVRYLVISTENFTSVFNEVIST